MAARICFNVRAGMTDDPFEGTAYRAQSLLGGGAMGQVFRVEHRELGAPFAAKILHERFAGQPQIADRMRLEAEALGRLEHPSIVSIMGFDATQDGRPFLVMELLEGRTLANELESWGALSLFESVAFTRQLLGALGAAHAVGVVHRDIKPGNLLLHRAAKSARTLKVLDFGIALVLPGAPAQAPQRLAIPTEEGAPLGTPRFWSPEAAVGERVDHRADIYGAGLILYTMLVGQDPFAHATPEQLLTARRALAPSPPSAHARQWIPEMLDRVVLRALDNDPAHRFQSASAFDKALKVVAAGWAPPADWVESTGFDLEPPAAMARGFSRGVERHPQPIPSAPTPVLGSLLVSEAGHAPALLVRPTVCEPSGPAAKPAYAYAAGSQIQIRSHSQSQTVSVHSAGGLGSKASVGRRNEVAASLSQSAVKTSAPRSYWFGWLLFITTTVVVALAASRGLAALRLFLEGR